jgi:hypothetical protein
MKVFLSCYHKTGTHFLGQLKSVLEKHSLENNYVLDIWSREANRVSKNSKNVKIVHLIRHPYEIIVSAYNYHKICSEPWCIDVNKRTLADNIQYNFNSQTYQQKLNTLTQEEGLNFEMSGRSFNTIYDMYNCHFHNFDFCLNVKMEDLYLNEEVTINRILNFLGVPNNKNMNLNSLYLSKNSVSLAHSSNLNKDINRHEYFFTEQNYKHFSQIFHSLDRTKFDYEF